MSYKEALQKKAKHAVSTKLSQYKLSVNEEQTYKEFFYNALKKFGVTKLDKLKGDKKKEFFDYVDANWKGKKESD